MGLAAITTNDAGDLVIRGLGVGIPYAAGTTDLLCSTISEAIAAYFAMDKKALGFCFLALSPLVEGLPAVAGGSLAEFLDALYAATQSHTIGVEAWMEDGVRKAVLTGEVKTTLIQWGAIGTELGKASFSGARLDTP